MERVVQDLVDIALYRNIAVKMPNVELVSEKIFLDPLQLSRAAKDGDFKPRRGFERSRGIFRSPALVVTHNEELHLAQLCLFARPRRGAVEIDAQARARGGIVKGKLVIQKHFMAGKFTDAFDPVMGFVQDVENQLVGQSEAIMKESTGAEDITAAWNKWRHHETLVI